jgi:predicted transcriptional regulator of viral defense system
MPEGKQWPLERLDPVLHEQDGFFTTAQADLVGVAKPKIDRILKAGLVRRVRRGVYVITRNAPMPRVDERIYAAWLAMDADRLPWQRVQPKVLVSHETAASLHGIGVIPDDSDVHLTAQSGSRTRQIGIKLHIAQFATEDWTWLRDHHVMATTAARTVVDLALRSIERDYVERAADDAVAQSLATKSDISSVLERCRRRPVRGSIDWLQAWAME